MAPSKKRGRGSKSKGRKIIFIVIPLVLILSLAFFLTFRITPPGKKHEPQRIRLPMPPAPEAKKGSAYPSFPRLALIIDDGGYNSGHFKGMMGLGRPMTFAILPHAPHSREAAVMARQDGSEVILHLPMEPKDEEGHSLEKDTIRIGMNPEKIQKILQEALKQIPHVRGVNNHMGSKATEDPQVMQALMDVLKKEKLYFIDSYTTPHTCGPEIARRTGVAFGKSIKFIDREKNIESIKEAIRFAVRKAKREGKALAIGHPHPLTALAIKEMIAEIEREGVRLVLASEVVG